MVGDSEEESSTTDIPVELAFHSSSSHESTDHHHRQDEPVYDEEDQVGGLLPKCIHIQNVNHDHHVAQQEEATHSPLRQVHQLSEVDVKTESPDVEDMSDEEGTGSNLKDHFISDH